MRTDEELVVAARSGEPAAFGALVERWTSRCWNIAWRILHDRDLAADVAQETLLTAWQQLDRLQQPAAFGGWVSRIARNRALDRLEQERRAVATADHESLAGRIAEDAGAQVTDPVLVHERGERRDLVWAAAAALGERDASVLDLHLRHGLEPRELAADLGIAPNAAHQVLFRLRKRLGVAIRAWLLWRGGRPRCERLAAELAAADVEVFGAPAVTLIERHADGCLTCEQERAAVVAPAGLFAGVPIAAMPATLADRVLTGLQQAGVPVAAAGREPAFGVEPTAASVGTPDVAPRGPRAGRWLGAGAGVGVAVLGLAVAGLVWSLAGGGVGPQGAVPPPAVPAADEDPAAAEPTDAAADLDPPTTFVLPPHPGGGEDPAVVPVLPAPTPPPLGAPDASGDAPAGDDPVLAPPGEAPAGGGGESPSPPVPSPNGPAPGGPARDTDAPDAGDPPEEDGETTPRAVIETFEVVAARGQFPCEDGAFPVHASWVTADAPDLRLRIGDTVVETGLPGRADRHPVCAATPSATFTLVATGVSGDTVTADARLG
ncbi:RNA polymerase sigma factor [Egicoccus sp. AB-alg2]|uniref:RNA polymerase sigma factor n=1 Tax=Egicoccus sp. AB-alg2 TaxID=3242693 RepID=UPI00359CE0A5